MNLNRVIRGLLIVLALEIVGFSYLFAIEGMESNIDTRPVVQPIFVADIDKEQVKKNESCSVLIQLPQEKRVVNPFKVIAPKTAEDILSLSDQKVQPVLYANTVPLSPLSIKKKKETFINMMLPSILLAKLRLKLERKKVFRLSQKQHLSITEEAWLAKKRDEFEVGDNNELYQKMAPHPTSLIIAQAIVESGWGTSKFFQQGNNVFGVWSFDKKDKRIVADEKRGDKSVYLKKYQTLDQSIHDYFLTISSVPYYEKFREKRLETQNPFKLVEHLGKYSELGDEYIANIKNIIRKNNLLDYDQYRLDL